MRTSHKHFFQYLCASFGFVFIVLFINSVWAADPVQPAAKSSSSNKNNSESLFEKNVAAAGVTYKLNQEALDITIDESRAVTALPVLEAEGVIPKIAPADIKHAPLGMAVAVVGVSFTVVIIDSIYTGKSDADKLHVQAFVVPTGSKVKQLCFSFDYDRDMYKKMDLNTLTPRSFMLKTPGFTFTDWCRTNMEKEAKMPPVVAH